MYSLIHKVYAASGGESDPKRFKFDRSALPLVVIGAAHHRNRPQAKHEAAGQCQRAKGQAEHPQQELSAPNRTDH
ncbi:hypothetical protein R75465_08306 [Paraburkholderia aspalathi]|nr:hypothetical protein R75465_08306 [Paraburkholderia aspalathi]